MNHDARLAALDPFIVRAARHFERDRTRADDLAQDARLAVWHELKRAERDGREVNDSYLKRKVKWACLDYLRATARETPTDDTSAVDRRADMGALLAAEFAGHAAEIADAIDTLTPRQREYVYLRFWCGLGKTELSERGYGFGLWYRPGTGARAVLASHLGHLADVA